MVQLKISFTIGCQIHGFIDGNKFVICKSIMWSAKTPFEIVKSINKYVAFGRARLPASSKQVSEFYFVTMARL